MKKCPQCGTTYTDETLRFCLADGTVLKTVGDSEPTLAAGHRDNLSVDVPKTQAASVSTPEPKRSSGRWLKILAVILVLGFVGIVLAGFAGFLLYYSTGRKEPAAVSKTPAPSPAVTATPDEERQRLEEEIANLRKKLEEQQDNTSPANTAPFPSPDVPPDLDEGFAIAIVNSPNDGFLALRSEPSVEKGKLLAKIPHASVIQLNNCEKNQVTVAGHEGRWCQVNYADQTGYVFDAFLIY
jgi:hypothetical protein